MTVGFIRLDHSATGCMIDSITEQQRADEVAETQRFASSGMAVVSVNPSRGSKIAFEVKFRVPRVASRD